MSDKPKRDGWEKVEILAKILGAILIPIVVGILGWQWNTERTRQSQFANMTEVAIEILRTSPEDPSIVADDYVRDWAISVLQSPESPPVLTDEAAQQLRYKNLPSLGYGEMLPERELRIENQLRDVMASLSQVEGACFWMTKEPSRNHKEFLSSYGFLLVGELEDEYLYHNGPMGTEEIADVFERCSDPDTIVKF